MTPVETLAPSVNTVDRSDRRFVMFAGVLAACVAAFVLWLVYGRNSDGGTGHVDLAFVRPLNAFWNGAAGFFLACGFVAIRMKKPTIHRYLMITALACSAFFLVGYLSFQILDGTRLTYEGAYRPLYLAILVTHTLLAMIVPLLAAIVVYFAARKRFASHKKIARIALPIWLYVSVTGVVIYEMLAHAS